MHFLVLQEGLNVPVHFLIDVDNFLVHSEGADFLFDLFGDVLALLFQHCYFLLQLARLILLVLEPLFEPESIRKNLTAHFPGDISLPLLIFYLSHVT